MSSFFVSAPIVVFHYLFDLLWFCDAISRQRIWSTLVPIKACYLTALWGVPWIFQNCFFCKVAITLISVTYNSRSNHMADYPRRCAAVISLLTQNKLQVMMYLSPPKWDLTKIKFSPCHYLNQCWLSANCAIRHKLQWNYNENTVGFN